MKMQILSFGYKNGIPQDVDIVMDVRFLPNPYSQPELRHLNGTDKEIQAYILYAPITRMFQKKFMDLLNFMILQNAALKRKNFTIAFGCEYGQYRSVAVAEKINEILVQRYGYDSVVIHRDMKIFESDKAEETPDFAKFDFHIENAAADVPSVQELSAKTATQNQNTPETNLEMAWQEEIRRLAEKSFLGIYTRNTQPSTEEAPPEEAEKAEPALCVEELPAPAVEKTRPEAEKAEPALCVEEPPAPAVEETRPEAEKAEPALCVEEPPAPAVEETQPEAEKAEPALCVEESPAPAVEKTQPEAEKAEPALCVEESPAPAVEEVPAEVSELELPLMQNEILEEPVQDKKKTGLRSWFQKWRHKIKINQENSKALRKSPEMEAAFLEDDDTLDLTAGDLTEANMEGTSSEEDDILLQLDIPEIQGEPKVKKPSVNYLSNPYMEDANWLTEQDESNTLDDPLAVWFGMGENIVVQSTKKQTTNIDEDENEKAELIQEPIQEMISKQTISEVQKEAISNIPDIEIANEPEKIIAEVEKQAEVEEITEASTPMTESAEQASASKELQLIFEPIDAAENLSSKKTLTLEERFEMEMREWAAHRNE